MRSPFLGVLVGLSLLAGCDVGDAGSEWSGGVEVDGGNGGGDDDGGGGGDDDGGGGGDDDGGGSGTVDAPPAVPRVSATVNKPTIATELGKTETLTLTVTSFDGFAGAVAIAASLVNAQGAPLTVVNVQGPTTVTLTANGTAPAQFTISVPSNASGANFTGSLKLDLSSSFGAQTVTTSLSVAAVYTMAYAAGTSTTAAKHPGTGKTISVKRGAKLRFPNLDSITHITHGGGTFPHEGDAGGRSGGTYQVDTIADAAGSTGTLGCHSHGSATYATYNVQ